MAASTVTFQGGMGPSAARAIPLHQRRHHAPTRRGAILVLALMTLAPATAHAVCPTFHSLTNGTTADATKVMDNFNHTLECPNFTGNVGIGTASPAHKLVIYGPAPRLEISNSNDVGRGGYLRDTGSTFEIGTQSGVRPLAFAYDGSEKMRIESNGRLGIGTTNPAYALHVANGSVGASGFVTTSDSRLKKSVTDIPYGLQAVLALHPVAFEWKDQSAGSQGRKIGLLAQEVEAVLPEIVSTDPKGQKIKGVAYGDLVPVVIKAIQEQATEIAALKAQNQELQRRLQALEQR